MLKTRRKHLQQLVRKTLEEGKNITVFGWMDSNHNVDTREYAKTKRVRFVEKKTKIRGIQDNLILYTRFVRGADCQKIKGTGGILYPHLVEIGILKKILSDCKDVVTKKRNSNVNHFSSLSEDNRVSSLDQLESYIVTTEVVLNENEKLANAFNKVSLVHPQKMFGSRSVTKILRETGSVLSLKELLRNGWIVPVLLEGAKKVSWYKIGSELQKIIDQGKQEEPKNPIEKALFLIARKQEFEAEIVGLQEKMTATQGQLKRIAAAEELIRQLKEV